MSRKFKPPTGKQFAQSMRGKRTVQGSEETVGGGGAKGRKKSVQ